MVLLCPVTTSSHNKIEWQRTIISLYNILSGIFTYESRERDIVADLLRSLGSKIPPATAAKEPRRSPGTIFVVLSSCTYRLEKYWAEIGLTPEEDELCKWLGDMNQKLLEIEIQTASREADYELHPQTTPANQDSHPEPSSSRVVAADISIQPLEHQVRRGNEVVQLSDHGIRERTDALFLEPSPAKHPDHRPSDHPARDDMRAVSHESMDIKPHESKKRKPQDRIQPLHQDDVSAYAAAGKKFKTSHIGSGISLSPKLLVSKTVPGESRAAASKKPETTISALHSSSSHERPDLHVETCESRAEAVQESDHIADDDQTSASKSSVAGDSDTYGMSHGRDGKVQQPLRERTNESSSVAVDDHRHDGNAEPNDQDEDSSPQPVDTRSNQQDQVALRNVRMNGNSTRHHHVSQQEANTVTLSKRGKVFHRSIQGYPPQASNAKQASDPGTDRGAIGDVRNQNVDLQRLVEEFTAQLKATYDENSQLREQSSQLQAEIMRLHEQGDQDQALSTSIQGQLEGRLARAEMDILFHGDPRWSHDHNSKVPQHEVFNWDWNYLRNMKAELKAKYQDQQAQQAKANAEYFVWGRGLGGIADYYAGASGPNPFEMFIGDSLFKLATGIDRNTNSSHNDVGEAHEGAVQQDRWVQHGHESQPPTRLDENRRKRKSISPTNEETAESRKRIRTKGATVATQPGQSEPLATGTSTERKNAFDFLRAADQSVGPKKSPVKQKPRFELDHNAVLLNSATFGRRPPQEASKKKRKSLKRK